MRAAALRADDLRVISTPPVPLPAPVAQAAPRPGALPGPPAAWQDRPYTQLLRGPRHRWWRPLVGVAVVLGGLLALVPLLGGGLAAASAVTGVDTEHGDAWLTTWWGMLAGNLGLAAAVPIAWLGVLAGHRWKPRWLASVVGRWRWRWALRLSVVPVVVIGVEVVVPSVVAVVTGEPAFGTGTPPSAPTATALLTVVLLTTPLQAAGEEYFFRGWLSQAVGSWFARPAVGAVVAALVSSLLFGAAHGPQDPWLFADRVAFGLVASWLVWRTGGLEASVVVHTVNNVLVCVPAILTGGLAGALAVTSAPPLQVVVDVAGLLVIAAGIAVLARRRGVARLFVPPVPGALPPATDVSATGGPGQR